MTRLLPLLFLAILGFAACGDDDGPTPENSEEVITNISLTLTPTGTGTGGAPVILSFSDPDGDGGNAPTTTVSGPLAANTSYTGALVVLNASDPTDVEDVTVEIRAEDEEHQIFYLVKGGLNLTAEYTSIDEDDDGNPLGIITNMTTGDPSSGSLTVIILHEPDKEASGITIGNPDPAGGETDAEVSFDLSIQ